MNCSWLFMYFITILVQTAILFPVPLTVAIFLLSPNPFFILYPKGSLHKARDTPLPECQWFPIVYGIKNSCGLHDLVSASVSPSRFTSCFLLSAFQTSGCLSFLKLYAPLDLDSFYMLSLLTGVLVHPSPGILLPSHSSYSLITLPGQGHVLTYACFWFMLL